MVKDPIIAEIHKKRAEHAKRFHYDLHAICGDIRRRQSKSRHLTELEPVAPRVMRVAESQAHYGKGERLTDLNIE